MMKPLLSMHKQNDSADILKNLKIDKCELMDNDEAEFLIDLIDTLSPS